MKRERDDQLLSRLMGFGVLGTIVGGGGAVFFLIGSIIFGGGAVVAAGFCALILILSLLTLGGAVGYGMWLNKEMETSGEVAVIPDCRVIARFAVNDIGETVFSDFDPEESKLYVKLQPPDGRTREYRTAMPTWEAALEGAKGTAHVQGDWLGQFEVQRPSPPSADADPYRR